jgi:hypothetical protein
MKTDADLPQGRVVGMTLVCPHCDLAVVIVNPGDASEQTLTCHTTMTPARPIRCWQVYRQPPGTATVAGALYVDEQSGLTVRCTRPAAGTVRYAGQPLIQTTAQKLRRRTVA